jgi:hypothetical protein
MAKFLAAVAPWIKPFSQCAAEHGHCVRSEERDLEKPENQDLRDALIYINGRRYYVVAKLEKYRRRRAEAPRPPKRSAPKTKTGSVASKAEAQA